MCLRLPGERQRAGGGSSLSPNSSHCRGRVLNRSAPARVKPFEVGSLQSPGSRPRQPGPPQPLTGVPGLLRGPGGGPDRRREAGNREGRGEGGGGARAPHVRLTCRLPPAFSPPLLPPQPMGVGGASAPSPSPPRARCAVTCAARGGGGKRRRGAVGGGSGLR